MILAVLELGALEHVSLRLLLLLELGAASRRYARLYYRGTIKALSSLYSSSIQAIFRLYQASGKLSLYSGSIQALSGGSIKALLRLRLYYGSIKALLRLF